MKKQAIFILDPKTQQLIQVCGVRDLTSDQFESFSKEAKKNIKAILKKHDEEEQAKETKRQEELDARFQECYVVIDKLARAVAHLLGYEEYSDEELQRFIYSTKQQEIDGDTCPEEPEFVETEESEGEPHE